MRWYIYFLLYSVEKETILSDKRFSISSFGGELSVSLLDMNL